MLFLNSWPISKLRRNVLNLTLKLKKGNSIEISRNAKNIAEKANIKDFNMNAIQGNANVAQTDMLFFLGTKALDAQLDNLVNKPSILPVRYYQIEQILAELRQLPSLKNINAKSYRYLMSPREPVTKDKPKKALILVLGAVLGACSESLWLCFSMRCGRDVMESNSFLRKLGGYRRIRRPRQHDW